MFEKVVTWLKVVKPKPQDEPADAEMKELAELIENGNPEDAEVLKRMAKLLGQTD
jgi:predicted NBD/HSP70 family sugar kinase